MPIFSVSEVVANGRKALAGGLVNPVGIVAWLLQLLVLTTPGLIASGLTIALLLYMQYPNKPWLTIAAPLYLLPLVFFAVIFSVLSTFTEGATEWVFRKLWGEPDPAKLTHRVGFFLLSVPICILVMVIFGLGGGGECSGSSRYCF